MGAKMMNARDADARCITLAMGEQQQYSKPLRCEFCEAGVDFVNSFFRSIGDDRVAVGPYFRLSRGKVHGAGCPHSVRDQISIIARKSDPEVLAPVDGDRFELRLLAVQQALSQLQDLAQKKQGKSPTSAGTPTEKQYVQAQKRLGGYINSAARVLKVRAACEAHAEIEDLLHLVFDGVRVRWQDFFFEVDDYFRCFAQVSQATAQVPIAVHGTIKSIRTVDGKQGLRKVINLMTPYRQTDRADALDAACFSVWSTEPQAFQSYQPNQEVVVFGHWEVSGIKENPYKNENSAIRLFRNHELRLWPASKSQVCAVKD